jgi:hypothetical protein
MLRFTYSEVFYNTVANFFRFKAVQQKEREVNFHLAHHVEQSPTLMTAEGQYAQKRSVWFLSPSLVCSLVTAARLGKEDKNSFALEVNTLSIALGSPWQNAFGESFNGRFRDDCLIAEWFYNLAHARVVMRSNHTVAWRCKHRLSLPRP